LQLVGVEITYESVEHALGVKNHRNYPKIAVVNMSADGQEMEGWGHIIQQKSDRIVNSIIKH